MPIRKNLLDAALSSWHRLSFLGICARKRIAVQSYQDDAAGFLDREGEKMCITRVILRPLIASSADPARLADIHEMAHAQCFIANTVCTEIIVNPR